MRPMRHIYFALRNPSCASLHFNKYRSTLPFLAISINVSIICTLSLFLLDSHIYIYSKIMYTFTVFFFFSAPNLSLRPSIYLQLIQVSPVAPDIWASYCTKLSAHQKLPILGLIFQDPVPFDDNWKTMSNKSKLMVSWSCGFYLVSANTGSRVGFRSNLIWHFPKL